MLNSGRRKGHLVVTASVTSKKKKKGLGDFVDARTVSLREQNRTKEINPSKAPT